MKVRDSYPYLTLNINSQPTQELQNRASSSKEVKNVGVPNSSGYPDKNFGVVTKKGVFQIERIMGIALARCY